MLVAITQLQQVLLNTTAVFRHHSASVRGAAVTSSLHYIKSMTTLS